MIYQKCEGVQVSAAANCFRAVGPPAASVGKQAEMQLYMACVLILA